MKNVPRSYFAHIRELEICTKPEGEIDPYMFQYEAPPPVTDKLVNLLALTPNLRSLGLCIYGSLDVPILSAFSRLHGLRKFTINNWAEENIAPL